MCCHSLTDKITHSLTHTSCRSTFLGWGKTLHICNKEGKGSVIECSSQIFLDVSPSHTMDCKCQFDQRLRYVCLLKNVNMLPRLILAHSSFYHSIIHYNLKCNFIWLLNWEIKRRMNKKNKEVFILSPVLNSYLWALKCTWYVETASEWQLDLPKLKYRICQSSTDIAIWQ